MEMFMPKRKNSATRGEWVPLKHANTPEYISGMEMINQT